MLDFSEKNKMNTRQATIKEDVRIKEYVKPIPLNLGLL